ncbi:MAG: DUF2155 domain-containing protein [Pacificimonas sp.]
MRVSVLVAATLLLAAPVAAQQATPMGQRVITVGVLDKVSQATETFEVSPGQTINYRGLSIAVRACEQTPPWAEQPYTGGFLQIDEKSRPGADAARVFSGWLYKETPALNSFDNPNYDVWVSACKMEWPDTGPDTIVVK